MISPIPAQMTNTTRCWQRRKNRRQISSRRNNVE